MTKYQREIIILFLLGLGAVGFLLFTIDFTFGQIVNWEVQKALKNLPPCSNQDEVNFDWP